MRSVPKTVVCLLVAAAVCAWGQITLQSNDITFRASGTQNQRTTHYGGLDVYHNGTNQVLRVYCNATGSADRVAVYGKAQPANGYGWGAELRGGAIGVYARTEGSAIARTRYGGYFYADAPLDNTTLVAAVCGNCVYNPDYATNKWGGYFIGKVYSTVGYYQGSDERIKKNVQPVENGLATVMALKPKQYEYDVENHPNLGLPAGRRMGLIAQDVELVLPNIVTDVALPDEQRTDTLSSIKSVDYVSLIPVLIAAIQEQQREIDTLKTALSRYR